MSTDNMRNGECHLGDFSSGAPSSKVPHLKIEERFLYNSHWGSHLLEHKMDLAAMVMFCIPVYPAFIFIQPSSHANLVDHENHM